MAGCRGSVVCIVLFLSPSVPSSLCSVFLLCSFRFRQVVLLAQSDAFWWPWALALTTLIASLAGESLKVSSPRSQSLGPAGWDAWGMFSPWERVEVGSAPPDYGDSGGGGIPLLGEGGVAHGLAETAGIHGAHHQNDVTLQSGTCQGPSQPVSLSVTGSSGRPPHKAGRCAEAGRSGLPQSPAAQVPSPHPLACGFILGGLSEEPSLKVNTLNEL